MAGQDKAERDLAERDLAERDLAERDLAAFDYGAAAELVPAGSAAEVSLAGGRRSRKPTGYGRFARAADAIRFAIEELPPKLRSGTNLKVDGERFDGDSIRRLYESAAYPLTRRAASQFPYEIQTNNLHN
jgi:hypothetical protein